MTLARLLLILVTASLLLPAGAVLLVGAGLALGAMGDAAGEVWFRRGAAGLAVLWGLALVALVTTLAVERLSYGSAQDRPEEDVE